MATEQRAYTAFVGVDKELEVFGLEPSATMKEALAGAGRKAMLSPSPQTDMATYWQLSGEILSGEFSGEFYYQPFYYAVFLPAIRFFWNSPLAVAWVQLILGVLTVYFAMRAAKIGWGKGAGYIAGTLTAVCTPLIFYTPFLMIANVQALFVAVIACFGVKLARGGGWRHLLTLAVALGLAILSRGNALYLLPGVVLLLFASQKFKRAAAMFAATLATVLALQAYFIVHNTRVRGELTGASTASGQVLALGNTPEAPPGGRDFNTLAGSMEYPETFHYWMAHAGERSVPARMLDWFAAEPAAFCELQFRKLLLFWDWREIPNNVAISGEGRGAIVANLVAAALPGVIAALGLAGVLGGLYGGLKRREVAFLWLAYIALGYWAATAAFYILSRFRAPVFPVLAILAAIFAARARVAWRSEPRRNFYLRTALPLLAGVFVVFSAYDLYANCCEAAVMRLVRPFGTHSAGAVFDHGPMSFGDWRELPLKPGMTIKKRFAAAPVAGKFSLELYSPIRPDAVVLEVNGVRKTVPINLTGTAEFEVPDVSEVTVKVISGGRSAAAMADFRRNCGRTLVNGEVIDGELVARVRPAAD